MPNTFFGEEIYGEFSSGSISLGDFKRQMEERSIVVPTFQREFVWTGQYKQRYLDFIMHNKVKNVFTTRNKIIDFIRSYLRDKEFTEVETPMMNMIPGGATARPF